MLYQIPFPWQMFFQLLLTSVVFNAIILKFLKLPLKLNQIILKI